MTGNEATGTVLIGVGALGLIIGCYVSSILAALRDIARAIREQRAASGPGSKTER